MVEHSLRQLVGGGVLRWLVIAVMTGRVVTDHRALGVVADIVANSERWYTSEKGSSCCMHDRKHEHGVNVRVLGGASGGLRGLCQLGITGRETA